MNEEFELLDPRNAQAFLKGFEAATRRKGDAHFRSGHVQQLAAEIPGMTYKALVEDGGSNEVSLHYEAEDGWVGECTCPEEVHCEHVFAAMRALLVEHSAATVRNLSAGIARVARTGSGKKKEEDSGGLERRLIATLGRSLNSQENAFLRKVH